VVILAATQLRANELASALEALAACLSPRPRLLCLGSSPTPLAAAAAAAARLASAASPWPHVVVGAADAVLALLGYSPPLSAPAAAPKVGAQTGFVRVDPRGAVDASRLRLVVVDGASTVMAAPGQLLQRLGLVVGALPIKAPVAVFFTSSSLPAVEVAFYPQPSLLHLLLLAGRRGRLLPSALSPHPIHKLLALTSAPLPFLSTLSSLLNFSPLSLPSFNLSSLHTEPSAHV
jgi:hypothetical protein